MDVFRPSIPARTMTAADPLSPSPDADLSAHAVDAATRHLRDVLAIALEHGPEQRALVVYDSRTGLSSTTMPTSPVLGKVAKSS